MKSKIVIKDGELVITTEEVTFDGQDNSRPVIRVSRSAYSILGNLSARHGIPISELASKMIEHSSLSLVLDDGLPKEERDPWR